MEFPKLCSSSPVLLIGCFLLLGCLSPGSPEQRLLCLELSEGYALDIPSCGSLDACEKAVKTHFFSEIPSMPASLGVIHAQYLNELAASWWYANKALERTVHIQKICQSAEGYTALPLEINALSFELREAFRYQESAAHLSFLYLASAQTYLEQQDIHQIPEDPLFQEYARLLDNLNQLQNPSIGLNSDTYVRRYWDALTPLDGLSKELSLGGIQVSETSPSDLWKKYHAALSPFLPSSPLPLPLVFRTVGDLIGFVERQARLEQGGSALSQLSPRSFLSLYNALAGRTHSAATAYAALVASFSSNLDALEAQITEREDEHRSTFQEMEDTLASFSDAEHPSLPEGFLENLQQLVIQIAPSPSPPSYFLPGSASLETLTKSVEDLHSTFRDQETQYHRGLSTKGRYLSFLKDLTGPLSSLAAEIRFLQTDFLDALAQSCSVRMQYISGKLTEPAPVTVFLQDLVHRTRFYTEAFSTASNPAIQLSHCERAISLYFEFQAAQSDQLQYETLQEKSIESCMNDLKQVQHHPGISAGDTSLLLQLSGLETPYTNPPQIQRTCEQLRERVLRAVRDSPEFTALSRQFLETRAVMQNIEKISSAQSVSPSSYSAALREWKQIKMHFDENGTPRLLSDMPSTPALIEKMTVFHEKILALEKEQIEHFIASHARIEFLFAIPPQADQASSLKIRVLLPNPFRAIPYPVHIQLPVQFPPSTSLHSPGNPVVQYEDGVLSFPLPTFPLGNSVLTMDANLMVAHTRATSEILFLSGTRAQIQETVEVIPDTSLPVSRIRILLPKPIESYETLYIHSEEEDPAPFTIQEESFFEATHLNEPRTYLLFYSIPRAVEISYSLSHTLSLDQNTHREVYALSLTNQLSDTLASPTISLPFTIPSGKGNGAALFDPSGIPVPLQSSADGHLRFSSIPLPPNQPVQYRLELTVEDPTEYWQRQLTNARMLIEETTAPPADLLMRIDVLRSLPSLSTDQIREAGMLLERAREVHQHASEDTQLTLQLNELLARIEGLISIHQAAQRSLDQYGFMEEAAREAELVVAAEQKRAALASSERGSLLTAYQQALTLHSELQAHPPLSAHAVLESTLSRLRKQTSELQAISRQLDLFPDLSIYTLPLQETESAFTQIISSNDLPQARILLQKYEDSVHQWEMDVNRTLRTRSNHIHDQLTQDLESVYFYLPEQIGKLADHLSFQQSLPEGEFAYVPPITLQTLEEYRKQLSNAFPEDTRLVWQSILDAHKDQNYSGAVTKHQAHLPEITRKSRLLARMRDSVSLAETQLKEDAAAYLGRVSLNAILTEEEQVLLRRAEKEIKEGNPLKATYIATHLSPQPSNAELLPFTLPLLVLLGLGGVAFYLHRRNQRPEQELPLRTLQRVKK